MDATTCFCGRGCKGTPSLTNPRIKSERDAVAADIAHNGSSIWRGENGQIDMVTNLDEYDARWAHGAPSAPKAPSGHAVVTPESTERKNREALAIEHIKTCTSRFGLILDLKADPRMGTKWMSLSPRQADAVLAHAEREAGWAAERAATPAPNAANRANPTVAGLKIENLPVGPAYFAVENEHGEVTFLRFRRLAADAKDRWTHEPYRWAGWVFVDQQLGPNYEKRGRIDPRGTYSGTWPTMVEQIMRNPTEAMARYGHEIGRCGYCNLPLTNAESREYGIGPICREKLAA
jgi:hypothetical protein